MPAINLPGIDGPPQSHSVLWCSDRVRMLSCQRSPALGLHQCCGSTHAGQALLPLLGAALPVVLYGWGGGAMELHPATAKSISGGVIMSIQIGLMLCPARISAPVGRQRRRLRHVAAPIRRRIAQFPLYPSSAVF